MYQYGIPGNKDQSQFAFPGNIISIGTQPHNVASIQELSQLYFQIKQEPTLLDDWNSIQKLQMSFRRIPPHESEIYTFLLNVLMTPSIKICFHPRSFGDGSAMRNEIHSNAFLHQLSPPAMMANSAILISHTNLFTQACQNGNVIHLPPQYSMDEFCVAYNFFRSNEIKLPSNVNIFNLVNLAKHMQSDSLYNICLEMIQTEFTNHINSIVALLNNSPGGELKQFIEKVISNYFNDGIANGKEEELSRVLSHLEQIAFPITFELSGRKIKNEHLMLLKNIKIDELFLDSCPEIDINSLEILSFLSNSLKKLNIYNVENCNDAFIKKIVKTFPLIESLYIDNSEDSFQLTDESCLTLIQLRHLNNILLLGLDEITPVGLKHLLCSLSLKTIKLESCNRISEIFNPPNRNIDIESSNDGFFSKINCY